MKSQSNVRLLEASIRKKYDSSIINVDLLGSFRASVLTNYTSLYSSAEIEKQGIQLIEQVVKGEKSEDEVQKDLKSQAFKYRKVHSYITNHHLEMGAPEGMEGMAHELQESLCDTYNAKLPHERYMLQIASLSMARYLHNSRVFEAIKSDRRTDKDASSYMSMLSKDMDRAMRSYMTVIQRFEAIRRPQPTIHLHSTNAAVTTNQLLNIQLPDTKNNVRQ